jgi:hypothetical protein
MADGAVGLFIVIFLRIEKGSLHCKGLCLPALSLQGTSILCQEFFDSLFCIVNTLLKLIGGAR